VDVLFGPGDAAKVGRIGEATNSDKTASGKTHSFYRYPARFSPQFAEAVIGELTLPGDWILDPFSGGGTSIIEALALGRKVVGVDINALAQFVTRASTTPLSQEDERTVATWADNTSTRFGSFNNSAPESRKIIPNFPPALGRFVFDAISDAEAEMALRRRRSFARCALLRLGQWSLEGSDLIRESPSWLTIDFQP
jgi:DNA methylase